MRTAYFDCFSGISGDMTLGALLACDVNQELFREQLQALKVPDYELKIETVTRCGITAADIDVVLTNQDRSHGRHLKDIVKIIQKSNLPERVQARSTAIFSRLADSEAKIHGMSREEIHFHEVGAVDAIVDIVGSCILLEMLSIERVGVSSIPCGTGMVHCQHGWMPIPAPATLELLSGFPCHSVPVQGELVTPTGAAIVTTLSEPALAGLMPSMRIVTTGYGAGKKQFAPEKPNVLRVVIGETDSSDDNTPSKIFILETNLDDHNPEGLELLMERALAAGALDIFYTPIQMKKNRPAILVTILCETSQTQALTELLFRETGTFGVRYREQSRSTLMRSWRTVQTPYGVIRLKVGAWNDSEMTVSPEYEDCKQAALTHNIPSKQSMLRR